MKKYTLLMLTMVWLCIAANAQENPAKLEKIAVLHVDSKGFTLDPVQMGNLVRLELDKLGRFEVMDRYDVDYLAEREKLKLENCYGKICLVETGKKLGTDKMLSGSVELISEKIIITFRLIDVGKETVEKSQVMDFLNLRPQVQLMIELTLRKMFGLAVDEDLLKKLTQDNAYESAINIPEKHKLNLSGPRMGLSVFSGETAKRLSAPLAEGGIDGTPVMFQFGYQFETSYLNQGGLQALFEFIPVITGLDQGQIIPSINILHGLRSNKSGFEFAFGPNLNVTKVAEGYYDEAGKWVLFSEWKAANPTGANPPDVFKRFDSRGQFELSSAFIFACGKSFRSGKLNIPVNVFFIPNRAGHRFGLSIGFNGRG
jgi:hypothetical protein